MIDIRDHGGSFGGTKKFSPFEFKETDEKITISTGVTYGNIVFALDESNKRIGLLTLAGTNRFLKVYDLDLNLIKELDLYSIMSPIANIISIIIDGDSLFISHGSSGSYAIQKILWNTTTPSRVWSVNNVYPQGVQSMYLSKDRQRLYALSGNIRVINAQSGVVENTRLMPYNGKMINAMCEINGKLFLGSAGDANNTNVYLFATSTYDLSGTFEEYVLAANQYYHVRWMASFGDKIAYLLSLNGSYQLRLTDQIGTLLSTESNSSIIDKIAYNSKGFIASVSSKLTFFAINNSIMKSIGFTTINNVGTYFLYVSDNAQEIIGYDSGVNLFKLKITY